uniref:Uncharacterized protein n=1 Tax=Megaselia scalaris TaxID=36166 RepID=T1GY02_MEGSC
QYQLLRQLNSVSEGQAILPSHISDRVQVLQEFLKSSLEKSHKEYEKRYNLRSRPVKFNQGQTVFKRNVILSDKNKNLNAKLCPKFVKCLVRNVLSQNRYELEDENGKFLGIYHAQDIRA